MTWDGAGDGVVSHHDLLLLLLLQATANDNTQLDNWLVNPENEPFTIRCSRWLRG